LNLQDTEGTAEEIDEGIFARYSPADRSLVGFTVVNFSKKFDATHRDVEIPLHA